MPAFGASLGASGRINSSTWTEVDVTADMSGNDTVDFALTSTSSTVLTLSSREGAQPAQLVITTRSGGGAGTPTATSTVPAPTDTPAPSVSFTLTHTPAPSATLTPTATWAAATLSFRPVADAYVDGSQPAANFGTALARRADASPIMRSYLRIDLQGLSGPATRATLRIYAASGSSAGITVRGVSDNTWTEDTINYNNASPAAAVATDSSGSFPAGTWLTVDVTPLVLGNGLVNMALDGINSTGINMNSKEAANPAQLAVETGGAAAGSGAAAMP